MFSASLNNIKKINKQNIVIVISVLFPIFRGLVNKIKIIIKKKDTEELIIFVFYIFLLIKMPNISGELHAPYLWKKKFFIVKAKN